MKPANVQSVEVVTKVVSILNQMLERGPMSAAALAEQIHEPRSTVYRLLRSLQQVGLIEPAPQRGMFQLGLHLFRLGSAAVSRFDERQVALPVMESMHAETGETIYMLVRHGMQAVCIERIEGKRVQLLATRLGGTNPLHVGAAPRLLLAAQSEAFWEQYLQSGPLVATTEKTLVKPKELLARLRKIRKQGYEISDGDFTAGIAAIGAPVFDFSGKVRAALSISGTCPAILGDKRRLIDLVVESASQVSHALGYRPAADRRENSRPGVH